mmetsp:Transcript_4904/g.16021  ORF Transcript_4904/g.16021 Transcript_4904/m.16021 type:complete len:368 (-) Transcript_4904:748-1851(-)
MLGRADEIVVAVLAVMDAPRLVPLLPVLAAPSNVGNHVRAAEVLHEDEAEDREVRGEGDVEPPVAVQDGGGGRAPRARLLVLHDKHRDPGAVLALIELLAASELGGVKAWHGSGPVLLPLEGFHIVAEHRARVGEAGVLVEHLGRVLLPRNLAQSPGPRKGDLLHFFAAHLVHGEGLAHVVEVAHHEAVAAHASHVLQHIGWVLRNDLLGSFDGVLVLARGGPRVGEGHLHHLVARGVEVGEEPEVPPLVGHIGVLRVEVVHKAHCVEALHSPPELREPHLVDGVAAGVGSDEQVFAAVGDLGPDGPVGLFRAREHQGVLLIGSPEPVVFDHLPFGGIHLRAGSLPALQARGLVVRGVEEALAVVGP